MSYSVLKNNGPDGKISYIADNVEDLTALLETNPPMGTNCLVLSDGNVYILNSSKKWVML